METLKTGLFALAIVGLVYVSLENRAHSEPLHHEVQVVTGGAVDASAFADTVRDEVSRFVPGTITVYVVVTPHQGATTVAVTIVAPRLRSSNFGRARLAIESTFRKSSVVRNGYVNVCQRISAAVSNR